MAPRRSTDDPRRSGCPISFTLDLIGDRWSALVVRDIALYDKHRFNEFLDSDEGIASNVLADRLSRLQEAGVLAGERDPDDGRRRRYDLTPKGRELIPVLIALAKWGAENDPNTDADPHMFARAERLL